MWGNGSGRKLGDRDQKLNILKENLKDVHLALSHAPL